MDTDSLQSWIDTAGELILTYVPKLVLALLLLVIGLRVINRVTDLAVGYVKRQNVAPTITPFVGSVVGIGLKVMLVFSVAGIVGIDTGAFVAVLAAAGFAIGLALQGSLANFAAGLIILLFRPYRIGEWIDVQDKFGKVEEIQIFNTIIVTPGKKTLIIPNGQITQSIVTNFSRKGHIRLELSILIAYEANFPDIREIILRSLDNDPLVLADPEPQVGIESFDTHNIIVTVRPFVHPDDYWEATFDVYARIKAAFAENKIKMAYSEGVELGPIGG